jgi:3-dehydroquinate synthase
VLALGGGTLEDEESGALLAGWGVGVWLDAPAEVLAARVAADAGRPDPRPLLAGRDPLQVLRELGARRAPRYAALPHRVDVGRDGAGEVAVSAAGVDVLRAVSTAPLREEAGGIVVGRGALARAGDLVARAAAPLPGRVVVATDGRVWSLHGHALDAGLAGAGCTALPAVLPEGEAAKSPDGLAALWHALMEAGADRDTPLLALGGGAVTDVAGLAAATYKRGVPLALFPTTLLSQADAAIGGKNAIDFLDHKNVIGTFHLPALVAADPLCLLTLTDRDYRSGWAEVVKSAVIGDAGLLDLCEQESGAIRARRLDVIEDAVLRAARVKTEIVAADPREADLRRALNLGHTLGHALEATAAGDLTHGEAVAIGMVAAARLAEEEHVAAPGLAARLAGVLGALGLPTRAPARLPRTAILQRIAHDKKRSRGRLHAVLPAEPGRVVVTPIEDGAVGRLIAAALEER